MLQNVEGTDRISFLTATLSCIGDGVIVTARDGSVLYINASGEKLTEWGEEEAAGRPFNEVFPLVDYFSGKELENPLLKALEQGKPIGLQNHAALITRTGERRFVSASCSPIYNSGGGAEGVVVVFRDIDRIKNMEEALKKSRDEAESSNRIKSEFIANMSHEIRTPLNGLIGMLELLSQTGMSVEQEEYVHMAKMSANALLKVISGILDFSKIEAGKVSIKKISFDVRALMDEIIKIHEAIADKKGLELRCRISSEVPRFVTGDPDRLGQILNNLIGNAIKFTDKGVISVSLGNIAVTDKEASLEFNVSDTGIGISAEKMELLFERFSQVDGSATRRHSGTGLGLAICKELAELMGGAIRAESEAGKGSSFVLILHFALESKVSADTVQESNSGEEQNSSSIYMEGIVTRRLTTGREEDEGSPIFISESPADPEMCSRIRLGDNGEILFQEAASKEDLSKGMDELYQLLRELKAILRDNRVSSIEETAHKVKKKAILLGSDELADLAFRAELASRKSKWDEASEYCVMMINEINFRYKEG